MQVREKISHVRGRVVVKDLRRVNEALSNGSNPARRPAEMIAVTMEKVTTQAGGVTVDVEATRIGESVQAGVRLIMRNRDLRVVVVHLQIRNVG